MTALITYHLTVSLEQNDTIVEIIERLQQPNCWMRAVVLCFATVRGLPTWVTTIHMCARVHMMSKRVLQLVREWYMCITSSSLLLPLNTSFTTITQLIKSVSSPSISIMVRIPGYIAYKIHLINILIFTTMSNLSPLILAPLHLLSSNVLCWSSNNQIRVVKLWNRSILTIKKIKIISHTSLYLVCFLPL